MNNQNKATAAPVIAPNDNAVIGAQKADQGLPKVEKARAAPSVKS